MGAISSNLKFSEGSVETNSSLIASSMDGIGDADFSLLDDLLIDILSFVSTKDLIYNCRLVCRDWKEIIDGHSVWKIKCERENKFIPSVQFDKLPEHYYEKIYVHDPYNRNLINNPCGEENLERWQLVRNPGDGFRIENPPNGADMVPIEVGSQHCFATTYLDCSKFQVIDLLSIGISEEILKLNTTKIEIGEWYAARFDCAAEYRLYVVLLNKDYNVNDEHFTLSDHETDNFDFIYREEQWVGREWRKVTHTFENVANARYVFFQHSGRDRQFWAGHYGSKMTGAYVKIIV